MISNLYKLNGFKIRIILYIHSYWGYETVDLGDYLLMRKYLKNSICF